MNIRFDTFWSDNFETISYAEEDKETSWQIDYDKEHGMYRVTQFLNNHWHGEVIFNEVDKNE